MEPALQALAQVMDRARAAGAGGVELLRTDVDAVELVSQSGASPRHQATTTASLVVRVWMDGGREGVATGTPDDADSLIAQAIAQAHKATAQPLGGPVDRFTPSGRGLGILDPRHEGLTRDDRIEILMDNVAGARGEHDRIRLGQFTWKDQRISRAFVNSRGVAQRVLATRYDVSSQVSLDDDPPIHLTDRMSGRTYADVACLPWGAALARRAVALTGTRVDALGPQRILLPPRATARIVAWLADRFDHDTLTSQRTVLTRNGGVSLSPRLHLLDDGSLPGGIRTLGFDERGSLPVPLAILREGRVSAHLLTPEQARALDLKPTGHVREGRVQPSNLVLNAGLRTINALLSDLGGTAIEVDELGSLDGLDETTGAFDIPFEGFVRDASGHQGVLRNVRLVGNLIEGLQQVVGIASDTDRVGHVDAPALLVDGWTVVPTA